jgi:4-hydroxybenzoate polyprenyltransferase
METYNSAITDSPNLCQSLLGSLFVIVYIIGVVSGNGLLAVFLMLALIAVGFIYLVVKAKSQQFTETEKKPTEKKKGFLSWFK